MILLLFGHRSIIYQFIIPPNSLQFYVFLCYYNVRVYVSSASKNALLGADKRGLRVEGEAIRIKGLLVDIWSRLVVLLKGGFVVERAGHFLLELVFS